jgi:predicted DNA-binding transcriptional regulator AlpA
MLLNVSNGAAFMTNKNPKKTWLSAAQVRQRYGGVSHMWIERRLDDPTFPRFVKFGRLRFWDEAALERWERERATT